VTTFEELDALSSRELHDRAVARAKRHLDVRFFWSLMSETPAAEASEGDTERSTEEVAHWSRQVMDSVGDNEEKLHAQRPIYIEYLLKHSE
jgi:hypothetical protein